MTHPAEDAEASMFTKGSPDLAIAWLNIHRVTLTPGPRESDEGELEDPGVNWHVYGVPSEEPDVPDTFLMFGDLALSNEDWFAGATTVAGVRFRDGVFPFDRNSVDDVNALMHSIGPWMSRVLYDTAAMSLQSIIATNFMCDLELPSQPPVPEIPTYGVAERAET